MGPGPTVWWVGEPDSTWPTTWFKFHPSGLKNTDTHMGILPNPDGMEKRETKDCGMSIPLGGAFFLSLSLSPFLCVASEQMCLLAKKKKKKDVSSPSWAQSPL